MIGVSLPRPGETPMTRSAPRVLAVLVWLAAASAQAGPIVPKGLKTGDKYYLAFITRDSRNATSSKIADYNKFVTLQAGLNPALTGTTADGKGVQWFAIASTKDTSAKTN